MENNSQQIFKDALAMPPVDKASLIEKLFHSFDKEKQQAIDQSWATEAESRIDAFENGELKPLKSKTDFQHSHTHNFYVCHLSYIKLQKD